ncbi:hypothetical protein ACFV24_25355 [Nocardia fluminea]|uniref:hypothetical protein n=1 Tax=Nocardia fluminea TaxID=134984 RepID=UPI00366F1DF0
MIAEHGKWKDLALWLAFGLLIGGGLLIFGYGTLKNAPECGGFEMGTTSQCKRIGSPSTVDYNGKQAANTRTGLILMTMGAGFALFSTYKAYKSVEGE